MAYVEVKAKTVELAVEAAMRELGVAERDQLEVKVLQEPERGFLGFGGRDAIVKVERAPARAKRSRNRRSKRSGGSAGGGGKGGSESGGGQRQRQRGQGTAAGAPAGPPPRGKKPTGAERTTQKAKDEDRETIDVNTQEPLVKEFLTGLVDAFGLEGRVETRVDDEVIVAEVVGEQTEALVGPRGSVMEAVHELTKTVLQRTVRESARVRIDIAGYAERRRQALTIYAQGLIDQVVADGGEIMLEPMSASDRKVIHDAVAARDGVRSYSEGESPRRYVVIASTGEAPVEAAAEAAEDAGADEVLEVTGDGETGYDAAEGEETGADNGEDRAEEEPGEGRAFEETEPERADDNEDGDSEEE